MEKRRTTLLGFLGNVFMIYGITNVILLIFAKLFGGSAREFSTIFSLGSDGIGAGTCVQFLAAITLLTAIRPLIMSSRLMGRIPPAGRVALLFLCALAVVAVFNAAFGWFPSDDAKAWIMFIACFTVSCAASVLISALAARQENKKLEQALSRLKEESGNE